MPRARQGRGGLYAGFAGMQGERPLAGGARRRYAGRMIVRPRPTAFGLLFTLRGSIVPIIAPRVLAILLLAAAVAWYDHVRPGHLPELTPAPFTLLGLALSIFLGFRNNACYDRWWEGRRQWGQLIVEARCLARDAVTLLHSDPALCRRVVRRAVGFAHALRAELRDTDGSDVGEWLPVEERDGLARRRNRGDAILRATATDLAAAVRRGLLSDILFRQFDERLTALATVQAACERLRTTPTPFTYSLLLHRTAWLFCLLLPFGLVGTLGLAAPIPAAILAYAFFGLDALGDELEEPFGLAQNNLPLDALVRAVEIDLLETLGEADLPEPVQAERYVLR
jgi:ion channel-forming bestrophin family protein